MKKLIIAFGLTILAFASYCQNTTEDLLQAKRVKDFIFIRPDFSNKKLTYQIDKVKEIAYDKSFNSSLNIAVRPGDEEINILSEFFNPFKYKVEFSDTSYLDANIASLGKAFDAVSALVTILGTQSPGLSTPTIGNLSSVPFIAKLKSPILSGWKFQFNKNSVGLCVPDFSYFTNSLSQLDLQFYDDSKGSFEVQVKDGLEEIATSTTLIELVTKVSEFQKITDKVEKIYNDGTTFINDFNKDLQRLDLNDPADTQLFCRDFLDYTKAEMQRFLSDVKDKQSKRGEIVSTLKAMVDQLKTFVKSGSSSNSMLIGRYAISEDKVREISLSFKAQDVKFENLQIKVQSKESVLSRKIFMRTKRTIIPEFSTGIFYTNLTYQKYAVQQINGNSIIVDAGTDRYPVVEAAHLNLVIDVFEGPVYPMLQLGIGTAKERPSILLGGGFRFTKPKRLAITYGRLWTWQKELNELGLGSKVDGQVDLDKDLRFVLQKKSDFYIGLQYNF